MNIREVDMQLEKEIYINSCSRSGGCTTIRRCNNCNEPGYNINIYKKDEEMFNVYSSNWFQLISGIIID